MTEQSQTDTAARIDDDTQCIQCGYTLRGVEAEGTCPECGLGVRVSTDRRNGLTARAFARACVRLYALALILLSVFGQYGILSTTVWYLFLDGNTSIWDWLVYLIQPSIKAFAGIVLWFIAPLLASLAAPFSVPFIANAGGPKLILALVSSVFAMWLISTGGEELLNAVGFYTLDRIEAYSDSVLDYVPLFITGIFRIVIGIFLIGWLLKRKELQGWSRSENA